MDNIRLTLVSPKVLSFVVVKKYAAIIMLMCISYQYMIKLGIMAWYEINKEYVAATYCENKDKPEMKCCGKCYLNKQLAKADGSSDSKQLPSKNHKIELVEFIPVIAVPFSCQVIPRDTKVFHDQYKLPLGRDPLASIFHPPPVVA
jgi:hypothetical protein